MTNKTCWEIPLRGLGSVFAHETALDNSLALRILMKLRYSADSAVDRNVSPNHLHTGELSPDGGVQSTLRDLEVAMFSLRQLLKRDTVTNDWRV